MDSDERPVENRPQVRDLLVSKVYTTVKQLIAKEHTKKADEIFDDILRTLDRNAQIGIRSVVQNILE